MGAPRYRRRRTPAAAAGALVQTDGSPFAWLEDRGPRLTLLGAIDDATASDTNPVAVLGGSPHVRSARWPNSPTSVCCRCELH